MDLRTLLSVPLGTGLATTVPSLIEPTSTVQVYTCCTPGTNNQMSFLKCTWGLDSRINDDGNVASSDTDTHSSDLASIYKGLGLKVVNNQRHGALWTPQLLGLLITAARVTEGILDTDVGH